MVNTCYITQKTQPWNRMGIVGDMGQIVQKDVFFAHNNIL